MKLAAIILLTLLCNQADAADLKLFDPSTLRKPVEMPVTLTLPAVQKAVAPLSIQADIVDGKFAGAAVIYPRSVSFSDARNAINSLYRKYETSFSQQEPKMGLWRNYDMGFSIQLTETEQGVQVIYLPFTEKPA